MNTQSNSANLGYNLITNYPRADYVCIDAPEARLAVSDRISNVGDIARRLAEDHIDCSKIIITQGKHGASPSRAAASCTPSRRSPKMWWIRSAPAMRSSR